MSTLEGLQDGKEQDNGRWIVSLLSTKLSYIEIGCFTYLELETDNCTKGLLVFDWFTGRGTRWDNTWRKISFN